MYYETMTILLRIYVCMYSIEYIICTVFTVFPITFNDNEQAAQNASLFSRYMNKSSCEYSDYSFSLPSNLVLDSSYRIHYSISATSTIMSQNYITLIEPTILIISEGGILLLHGWAKKLDLFNVEILVILSYGLCLDNEKTNEASLYSNDFQGWPET